MKTKSKKYLILSTCILAVFVLWTLAVCMIDVQPIGPNGSEVGFALLNGVFHELTGVHMSLYTITDWLGLVPIAVALAFVMLGLAQWIKRRRLRKVDFNIFVLGGLYIITMAAYILFEYVVINRRPILIEGFLEASYPSSTTMLVLCVMPTAMMQFHERLKNRIVKYCVNAAIAGFSIFMVVGRLISGVHWLTDIIGGMLLSMGLVTMYYAVSKLK